MSTTTKYAFIDLDQATKNQIAEHLKNYCGIEMLADKSTKEQLIEAVISFEENNGLLRPQTMLPKDMRTDLVEQAEAVVQVDKPKVIPMAARRKVRIILRHNGDPQGQTQQYVSLNEWNAIIVYGAEVDIPEPVYHMLRQAVETHYKQNKDGSIQPFESPSYNVEFVGYTDQL